MADGQNLADYRLTLEGQDLGPADAPTGPVAAVLSRFAAGLMDAIGPRMVSLELSEKRGGEADELAITIHDHDGAMEIPKPGAVIALQLGWKRGADVTPGLVDKGRFKVDEAEWSGPPDIITIRARSADFAANANVRRERSHVSQSLGAIVRKIAATMRVGASIDPTLAAIVVDILAQDGESDGAFLRRLGRRYDATATVKNGTLIFAPIGKGATATGKAIPPGTITRASGDSYAFRRGERGQFDGVEARYHDIDKAKRETVRVGAGDGSGSASGAKKPKRLKRVYASRKAAERGAKSAHGKMQRAAASFELTLALGRPDLYPDRPMTLSGFKPEIDGKTWLIAEATHTLDENGLATRIKLEAKS